MEGSRWCSSSSTATQIFWARCTTSPRPSSPSPPSIGRLTGPPKDVLQLVNGFSHSRCSHVDLEGLSTEELRSAYSNVSTPSCTLLVGVVNGTGVVAESGECKDWIFMRESGYESITTEVGISNVFQFGKIILISS